MSPTFALSSPDDLLLSLKRRGIFDELRKELLDAFQSSEEGSQFTVRIRSLLASEIEAIRPGNSRIEIHRELMDKSTRSKPLAEAVTFANSTTMLHSKDFMDRIRVRIEDAISKWRDEGQDRSTQANPSPQDNRPDRNSQVPSQPKPEAPTLVEPAPEHHTSTQSSGDDTKPNTAKPEPNTAKSEPNTAKPEPNASIIEPSHVLASSDLPEPKEPQPQPKDIDNQGNQDSPIHEDPNNVPQDDDMDIDSYDQEQSDQSAMQPVESSRSTDDQLLIVQSLSQPGAPSVAMQPDAGPQPQSLGGDSLLTADSTKADELTASSLQPQGPSKRSRSSWAAGEGDTIANDAPLPKKPLLSDDSTEPPASKAPSTSEGATAEAEAQASHTEPSTLQGLDSYPAPASAASAPSTPTGSKTPANNIKTEESEPVHKRGALVAAFVPIPSDEDSDLGLKCFIVKIKRLNAEKQTYVVVDPDPEALDDGSIEDTWDVHPVSIVNYKSNVLAELLRAGDRVYALYREAPDAPLSTEFYESTVIKISKNIVSVRYSDGDTGTVQRDELFKLSSDHHDRLKKHIQTHYASLLSPKPKAKTKASSKTKGKSRAASGSNSTGDSNAATPTAASAAGTPKSKSRSGSAVTSPSSSSSSSRKKIARSDS